MSKNNTQKKLKRKGDTCPKCKLGKLKIAQARNGFPSEFEPHFLECEEECGYYYLVYTPLKYQEEYHLSKAKVKGYFGGYGAGKTTSGGMEIISHIMSIPNGVTLLGADSISQMNQTNKKMIDDLLPLTWYEKTSLKPNDTYYDLINGHRVMFKVLDSSEKLRSLNLTAAWIEEASVVEYDIFAQLLTRMRHQAGNVYAYDKNGEIIMDTIVEKGVLVEKPRVIKELHLITLTSNPDPGWIKEQVLFHSGKTNYYGTDKEMRDSLFSPDPNAVLNKDYECFVVPTEANIFLPKTFIASNSIGKPDWWVERYLKASFAYSEGLVFTDFAKIIVEPFTVPLDWPRFISVDFGRRDPMVYMYWALDVVNGVLYLIGESYIPNGNNTLWFNAWAKCYDKYVEGSYLGLPAVADPAGWKRDQVSGMTWANLFSENGVTLIKANTESGQKSIAAGIAKVDAYITEKKIKVFNTCGNTIKEGRSYMYKERKLHDGKNAEEAPIEKDNHTMDAMRYMISKFPENPKELGKLVYTSVEQATSIYDPFKTEEKEIDYNSHYKF